MAAAGFVLHPACRVRQEGFGLLFYDSRGPRLLFAQTGRILPEDFFRHPRSHEDLPPGLSAQQKERVSGFIRQLLEKGFLREQPIC